MRLNSAMPVRFLPHAVALAAIASVLALAPSRASAQGRYTDRDTRARIDTTFAFDKSGVVSLTTTSGDVIVTGSSSNEIHVHVTSEDRNVRVDASSSRLELDQTSGGDGDVRYEITVPYGVRVISRARSGDIAVRGTRGEVEANSQNGDVHVSDVVGHLDVSTFSGDVVADRVHATVRVNAINGDVTVRGLTGDADITTVSGDVQISGAVSRNLRLQSTSGDLSYGGSIDTGGRYDLTTHSGDVELRIPRAASAQMTVSTWSGTIDSEFPIVLRPGEHGIGISSAKHFTFDIGRGESRIDAETFSGDITIRTTGATESGQ
jgi:DUF4097 and DUF4098 domain-containing protein YvlB